MAENIMKKSTLLKWGICFALLIMCMLIPVGELFTPICRRFVAVTVFCIMLLAFDLLDSMFIGLLLPMLWVVTGCATFAQAMSGWASSYPFISTFVLAKVLERIGLLKRIGYHVITLCGGSFNKTIFGLFIACNIVAVLTFGMGLGLACALGLALMVALELKPSDPQSSAIALAVILGGIQSGAYIYSPVSVTMIVGAAKAIHPEFRMSWMELAGHNFPVLIFGIVFLWCYLKWLGKKHPDGVANNDKQREYFKSELEKMGHMKTTEKKALAILIIMLVYMLISPFINLDLAYGFFIACLLMFMPFINIGTTADIRNGLNMSPIVFLVLAFISIGSVGTACGFGQLISTQLVPIMDGLGEVKSIYATLFIGTLSNFILTPGAMIMLLTGPVVQFCADLGYNYLPHVYSIYLTEHAIFHPYEWPSYLTVFAFGLIQMNAYVKLCCTKTIFYLLFVCLIMVPWWLFITG